MNKKDCLLCKAPLEYLEQDLTMECAICHQVYDSKTRCVNGHYICDACHTQGLGNIMEICTTTESANPYIYLKQMMNLPTCHLHGPEHHLMVGSALLAAYCRAGGHLGDSKTALYEALIEMQNRGKKVPGGACGFWGSCGAAISAGMFIAIVLKATPLSVEEWGMANSLTGRILLRLGEIGGPRCCKRNSFVALIEAVRFVKEKFGIAMEEPQIHCSFSHLNNQCIKTRCPFYPAKTVRLK